MYEKCSKTRRSVVALKAYYLDQMGIDRWVKRPMVLPKPLAILVIYSQPVTEKAQLLFEQMLHTMGLTLKDVECIAKEEIQEYKERQPKAIWAWQPIENVENIPYILTPSPDELIQAPMKKKEVFLELLRLSTWMCDRSQE